MCRYNKEGAAMNTKNNQRYIKTEEEIDCALNSLLKKKLMRNITVQDICNEAKIHRTTFYGHYLDIFDLIEKKEQQMRKKLYERLKKKDIKYTIASLSLITTLIEHIKENKDFYTAYLNDFGNSYILAGFDMVRSTIDSIMSANNEKSFIYNELKYTFEFCQNGFLSVILLWLNNNCRESVKEISEMLFRLLGRIQSPYSDVLENVLEMTKSK